MSRLQAERFKRQGKDQTPDSHSGFSRRVVWGLGVLVLWSLASWIASDDTGSAHSNESMPTLASFTSIQDENATQKSPVAQDELAQDEESTERDQEFSAADIQFFETQVRPILVDRCGECHGVDSAMEAGLSTASRAALLRGGDTGPAIVPAKPDDSLLLEAISYDGIYQMPPDSKLPAAEIATLHEWVERGAPWTPQANEELAGELATFDLAARKAEHWCWQPIDRPTLPTVQDAAWVRDELDRFILAKLEEAGLKPNEPAAKTDWLRRVYFDLTGLPPSPGEVAAFLADERDDAYERVVNHLLDSPHFGERWARHWMDLVRYAETCGHEFDYPIPAAWRYRDYLIRAFNADVPYNQLIREHVAGDLLATPRRHPQEAYNESIIGTGFWYMHEATHAPVDVRGDEAGRVDNQIDVLSKTFLGLTVACARCHDHKFDAISTKDYYALAGFIQSSHRHEAVLDPDRKRERAQQSLAKLRPGALQQWGKHLQADRLTTAELASVLAELKWVEPSQTTADGAEAEAAKPTIPISPDDPDWLVALKLELVNDAANQPDHPLFALRQLVASGDEMADLQRTATGLAESLIESEKQYTQALEDSVLFADFAAEDTSNWYLTGNAFEFLTSTSPTAPGPLASPELGVAKPGSLSSGGLSKKLCGVARSKTFTITHSRIHHLMQAEKGEVRLVIDGFMMNRFSALLFSDATKGNINTNGKSQWIQQAGDIGRYIGHRAHLEFVDQGDGYLNVEAIRFSNGNPPPPKPHPWLVAQIERPESDGATLDAKGWYSTYAKLLQRSFASLPNSPSTDNASPPSHDDVEHAETTEQRAAIDLSTALTAQLAKYTFAAAEEKPSSKTDRLISAAIREDARQIEDGLGSPIIVTAIADGSGENEHVFVRGNHRVMGETAPRQFLTALTDNWPSNITGSGRLELAERIADADNPLTSRVIVNRLWHHLFGVGIVASVDNFGVLGKEPTHPQLLDYLAREFTETHDWSIKSMLKRMVLSQTYRMSSHPDAVADKIDPENRLLHRMRIRRLEGESIRDAMLVIAGQMDDTMYGPSVPVYLTPFMQGRGRPGKSGPLNGANRRSIYLEVRRNFLNPMMLAFDTPIPFSTVGRRNRSNVPAQALILLNDPFVQEQAHLWADRVIKTPDQSDLQRIQQMYEQAFMRAATEAEVANAIRFLERQSSLYRGEPSSSQLERNSEAVQLTSAKADSSAQHSIDARAWTDLAHVLFNVKEFIYLK